jgi:cytochrome P450
MQTRVRQSLDEMEHHMKEELVGFLVLLLSAGLETTMHLLTIRQTTQEVELGGARLPKGALVTVLLGSVNHDEAQFPHGDRCEGAGGQKTP